MAQTGIAIAQTVLNTQTVAGTAVKITRTEINAISCPNVLTPVTISFQGAYETGPVNNANQVAPTSFQPLYTDTGALVSITVAAGRLVALTLAQTQALKACHWIKAVFNSAAQADQIITYVGTRMGH